MICPNSFLPNQGKHDKIYIKNKEAKNVVKKVRSYIPEVY